MAQVRNEINVLKRVSAGHKNIVQLHDFFETTHNLYVSGAAALSQVECRNTR
jgi:hypothetical protein